MVGERLVDGPDPAGRARAGGWPRASRGSLSGDGRSRRRPRLCRLAETLEAAARRPRTSRGRARRPRRGRRAPGQRRATARALATLWRPAVRRVAVTGASRLPPRSSIGVVCGAGGEDSRREPGWARGAAGGASSSTTANSTTSPGQSANRPRSAAAPVIGHVDHEGRGRRTRHGRAAQPLLEQSRAPRRGRRRRPGGPIPRSSRQRAPGRYGSKLPAYSSASTTNLRPAPDARCGRDPRRRGRRQQRTDECGWVASRARPADGRASRPWWTCRGSRPTATRRPTDGSVGDQLRATAPTECRRARRIELRVVRRDRRQRLRHREPTRPGFRRDVRRVVLPTRWGCRRLRRPACTAMGRPGRSRTRPRPRPGQGSPAALAPAPAMPTTWIRSPATSGCGSRAAARPAPISAALRFNAMPAARRPRRAPGSLGRSSRAPAAVPAPRPRWRACSRRDRAATGTGARRSRPHRPRRRRRARRLCVGAAARPGDPGDRRREVGPEVAVGRPSPSRARSARSPHRGQRAPRPGTSSCASLASFE